MRALMYRKAFRRAFTGMCLQWQSSSPSPSSFPCLSPHRRLRGKLLTNWRISFPTPHRQ